ncbi:MAG: hypothetical protein JJE04_23230 [Acidobacteriia bacterium]|nr:hypothetical protein [Terriglobia bacterium]
MTIMQPALQARMQAAGSLGGESQESAVSSGDGEDRQVGCDGVETGAVSCGRSRQRKRQEEVGQRSVIGLDLLQGSPATGELLLDGLDATPDGLAVKVAEPSLN